MAAKRFGCRVDGVSISEKQVEFANDQAVRWSVADRVRFHFKNMLDTGFETGSRRGIWTNETTMYVDLNELFGEFSRLLGQLAALYSSAGPLSDVDAACAAHLVDAAGGRRWSRRQADMLLDRALDHLRAARLCTRAADELAALARLATHRDH
jgi:hypothetical protein